MDQEFLSCCDDGRRIDMSKMEVPNLFWYIYWDRNFTWTLFWIIFYPIYWILISQWEYRSGCLRRFFGGPYIACGLVALTLIPMSIYRDCRFLGTVRRQPEWWLLRQNGVLWTGHGLILIGLVLVVFSFRVLGLWASLLGDFFGIHETKQDIRHRFPYTWFQHPMYCGSIFIFFGYSLGATSQAGIFLSFVAMVMYCLAIYFEHAVLCRYHHISVEVGVQAHLGDDGTRRDTGEIEEKGRDQVEDIGEHLNRPAEEVEAAAATARADAPEALAPEDRGTEEKKEEESKKER